MTAHIGLFLSSEEHPAGRLVDFARRGEDAGLDRVVVSDHYHPWTDSQGHAPFVWPVLGGIAATTRLLVTTGVTCPTVRLHPAVVAQAAATAAEMAQGRFRLGVGSGEALNEHILGGAWPRPEVRLEMLEEAVALMRSLWGGGFVSHRGRHYTVEGARVYEQPAGPIPVLVSGFGPKSVKLAARIGDGYVAVRPERASVERYVRHGGQGPRLGLMKVCWGPERRAALELARARWSIDLLPGELAQTLPMPAHFAQATSLVTEEMVAGAIPCGPDPEPYVAAVRAFEEAGFDEVYVNQIGADLDGFLRFFDREIRPALQA